MVISTNFSAMNCYRNLNKHSNGVAKALQRLSSGLKINSAADDPSGMAISQRMKAQLRELEQEERNALDKLSELEMQDGHLAGVQDILDRMTELATKAASGSYNDDDRAAMNAEYQELMKEINRIGENSENRESVLVSGKDTAGKDPRNNYATGGKTYTLSSGELNAYLDSLDSFLEKISLASKNDDNIVLLSLGIDKTDGLTDKERLSLAVSNFTKEAFADHVALDGGRPAQAGDYSLSLNGGAVTVKGAKVSDESLGLKDSNILTQEDAGKAMTAVKDAINKVSKQRGEYGATMNRIGYTLNNLASMQVNLSESISRITDADMAKEMMNFTREKALEQAAMFALSQANQRPYQVISLLNSM